MRNLSAAPDVLDRKASVEDYRRSRVMSGEDLGRAVASTKEKIDLAFSGKARYSARLKA